MVDKGGGDVFLLLPEVLLEGGESEGYLGMGGLDLVAADPLVERVLSRTMLPIGRRLSLLGIMSKQTSETLSLILTGLDLVDLETKPFFVGAGMFTTFTFFSQLEGNSPVY